MMLREAFALMEIERNTVQHGPYNDYKAAQKKALALTNRGFSGVRVGKGGQGSWLITATKPKAKAQQ